MSRLSVYLHFHLPIFPARDQRIQKWDTPTHLWLICKLYAISGVDGVQVFGQFISLFMLHHLKQIFDVLTQHGGSVKWCPWPHIPNPPYTCTIPLWRPGSPCVLCGPVDMAIKLAVHVCCLHDKLQQVHDFVQCEVRSTTEKNLPLLPYVLMYCL